MGKQHGRGSILSLLNNVIARSVSGYEAKAKQTRSGDSSWVITREAILKQSQDRLRNLWEILGVCIIGVAEPALRSLLKKLGGCTV